MISHPDGLFKSCMRIATRIFVERGDNVAKGAMIAQRWQVRRHSSPMLAVSATKRWQANQGSKPLTPVLKIKIFLPFQKVYFFLDAVRIHLASGSSSFSSVIFGQTLA